MTDVKEKEIIQLRKHIYHLEKTNRNLKEELDEQKVYVGKLEIENSKLKNESILITKTKLSEQNERIKYYIEQEFEEDKKKIEVLTKQNNDLSKQLHILEININGSEEMKNNLQKENNALKAQLTELAKTNKVEDLMLDVQAYEKLARQKEYDYQKVILQWNELVDKMEKVMSENAILREWANVPQNFGLPIDQIKIGEKKSLEYYKAALRRAEDEIRELEEERARLKNKLFIYDSYRDSGETPLSVLTKEEHQKVMEYAVALHEKRAFIVDSQYALYEENKNLKLKIEILEKQLDNIKIEAAAINYNRNTQFQNVSNDYSSNRINPNANTNSSLNKELVDQLQDNFRKELSDMKNYLKNTVDGIKGNELKNMNNFYYNNYKDENSNDNLGYSTNYLNLSKLQRPPYPLVNNENPDNDFNVGFSNRFNNRFKVDINQILNLFGIVPLDSSQDKLKSQAAYLMSHLLETLEIVNRMKLQDANLNSSLGLCGDQIQSLVLNQNSLFKKFINSKNEFIGKEKDLNRIITELKILLEEEKIKRSAFEESFRILETKDLSTIERRIMDKIKENSILEMKLLHITRKYGALYEEHSKLKSFVDELQNNSITKDHKVETLVANLKEWKSMLTFYVKMMLNKLKNSVDKKEYDKISMENSYLRDRQKEIVSKEIYSQDYSNNNEYLKIKIRELENSLLQEQEIRTEVQLEYFHVKDMLRNVDPLFSVSEEILNKFVLSLLHLNISLEEFCNLIDYENRGFTSGSWLKNVLEDLLFKSSDNVIQLKDINIEFSEIDVNLLYKLICFEDENKEIDVLQILKFIKKNSFSIKKDDDISVFDQLISNLKNQGNTNLISLLKAFDTLDSGIIQTEEFSFVINSTFNPINRYYTSSNNKLKGKI